MSITSDDVNFLIAFADHGYQPDFSQEPLQEQIIPKPAPIFAVKPERPIYVQPLIPHQKPIGIPNPVPIPPPEIHLLPYEQLPQDPVQYESYLRQVFNEFMVKYKRDYINVPGEREYRFSLFADNYHTMNEHAVSDRMAAHYSVTEFSDFTDGEFSRIMGFDSSTLKDVKVPEEESTNKTKTCDKVPDSYDERQKNHVTRVKLQGDCAACWAFTTVAVIEGLCARQTKKLQGFSSERMEIMTFWFDFHKKYHFKFQSSVNSR